MNINDVGYNVTIGEPVVDAKGVADSGLSFPCKAIPDGDYLVTLEVNGTVIAGRDKATFASGSATVGDYTLSYSSYAVSVATLTDDDVVVLRIEPLDIKVSDAFRAVVGKAAPAAGGGSSGGGSGGGVLVVNAEYGESTYTLDKTWQEIHDAMLAGGAVLKLTMPDRVEAVTIASYQSKGDVYVVIGHNDYNVYATSTASGYPSYTV